MGLFRKILIWAWVITYSVGAHANVVGNGLQNFNTIPSGLDFVTVHSSETLQPGLINIGLYLNNAYNSLPYRVSSTQGRTEFNDELLTLDVNIGYGVTSNFEVGLSTPQLINQKVSSTDASHGQFASRGNTEVRYLGKYRFKGDASGGWAIIGSVNENHTINNPYLGVDGGPSYNLEVAYDWLWAAWAMGINIGYRWINAGGPVPGSFIDPMVDQYLFSFAASRLIPNWDTKMIFEIYSSIPSHHESSNIDRVSSSAEFLAGLKHDINTHLAAHTGMGTELIHGSSSPDWRIYAGLNYTFGPYPRRSGQSFTVIREDSHSAKLSTQQIQFEFDSEKMTGEGQKVLDEVAASLRGMKFKTLLVVGHTDSLGDEVYNQQLSLRRSQAIRKYLVETKGFSGKSLESLGKGESEPIADNGNYQGRQQNRRVEFLIRN